MRAPAYFAALLAGLLVATASPANSTYRVDAIVFLNQATPNGSPDEASAAIRQFTDQGIRFGNASALRNAGVVPLPDDDTALATEWNRLRNARAFVPYVRAAWVQPGLGPSSAPSVRLNDGVAVTVQPTPQTRYVSELYSTDDGSLSDSMDADLDGADPTSQSTGDTTPEPPSQRAPEVSQLPDAQVGDGGGTLDALGLQRPDDSEPVELDQLDGTIQLYAQRYLHLDLDLWWIQHADGRRIAAGDSLNEADARIFHIDEQRRIRIGELHYFDHPRFGVLVKVTRVEE